jgi:ferredoxin--NADP+ reductase
LFDLKIGDKLWVGTKFVGMFTLDEIASEQNIVLIATGTGVAPYMSMLRSDALKRKGNIVVVHGAANSWDLGYSSELNLLQSIASHFKYVPTITNPEKEMVSWHGHTKFIQEMWKDGVVSDIWGFKPTPENTHIFLCGNPRMIADMCEALEHDGFTEHSRKNPGQIHIEKF